MSSFKQKHARFWAEVFDLFVFLVLVFWIVLFIRLFIGTPYTVIWSSMSPNFEEKDWIIVEKITQRFGTFDRGDVIVFVAPWKESPYIKRIIWLPWETVLFQDGDVYICSENIPAWAAVKDSEWNSCEILPESYLPEWLKTNAVCGKSEFKVDEWYFVMGDNRNNSSDSRDPNIGNIKRDQIIGRAFLRIYPFNKLGLIKHR